MSSMKDQNAYDVSKINMYMVVGSLVFRTIFLAFGENVIGSKVYAPNYIVLR